MSKMLKLLALMHWPICGASFSFFTHAKNAFSVVFQSLVGLCCSRDPSLLHQDKIIINNHSVSPTSRDRVALAAKKKELKMYEGEIWHKTIPLKGAATETGFLWSVFISFNSNMESEEWRRMKTTGKKFWNQSFQFIFWSTDTFDDNVNSNVETD